MPTISLTKTNDTIPLVFGGFDYEYYLPRDLYTGVFTDTGMKGNVTHRQNYWQTVATPFTRVNNGKPSALLRGGRDCAPGPSSPQYAQPISVAWGLDDPNVFDGWYDSYSSSSSGDFVVQCRWCDFDDLQLVTDISSFMSHATVKYIQIDGLKYFNNGSTYQSARPTHAYPIIGDIPDWYFSAPTHMAGERRRLAPFVPCEPADDWYVNPNDPTTPQTARYIDGELCTPAFPQQFSALPVPYISSGSQSVFLGSMGWINDGESEYYRIERTQEYSPLSGFYWRVSAFPFMSFHRGILPNVNLRLYGNGYFSTPGTIRIRATCYPSGTDVILWSESVNEVPLDFYRPNVALSVLGIPVETVQIRLMAEAIDDGTGSIDTLDIAVCQPIEMYGVNPVQTTDWPEVVPGFVRKVAVA